MWHSRYGHRTFVELLKVAARGPIPLSCFVLTDGDGGHACLAFSPV